MFVMASCQSEPLCPEDGRSSLIDASDHKAISTSQMIRRSYGAISISSACSGEYPVQPVGRPPPKLARYLPTASSASPRAITMSTR